MFFIKGFGLGPGISVLKCQHQLFTLSSSYYVPDTVLGAGDSAVNKRDTDPLLMETTSKLGRQTISR